MTPDDIRQQIELKVVELVKARLADGTMDDERGQQISQRVLDLLQPGMTMEALYKAISKLDDSMPELSPIVLPYLRDYEHRVTKQAQENVRNLIKLGQYDAAIKLAEKVIKQDVALVWEGRAKYTPPPPPPPPRFPGFPKPIN